MSILASPYYLTTQRDDSSAKTREQMTDCGDQSNYKTFFYHDYIDGISLQKKSHKSYLILKYLKNVG